MRNQKGYTFVEVIVILLVLAVVGALVAAVVMVSRSAGGLPLGLAFLSTGAWYLRVFAIIVCLAAGFVLADRVSGMAPGPWYQGILYGIIGLSIAGARFTVAWHAPAMAQAVIECGAVFFIVCFARMVNRSLAARWPAPRTD
jgi:hypothetical protein